MTATSNECFRPSAGKPDARDFDRRAFSDALDALGEGFALWDGGGRLVFCNGAYRRAFPLIAADLMEAARFDALLRLAVERGQFGPLVDAESWLRERLAHFHKGGGEFECPLADGRWLRIGEHRAGNGMVSTVNDMSASRRHEAVLAECGTRSRQLAAAVDAAPTGVFIMDPHLPGNPLGFVNPAFARITGFGPGQIRGQSLTCLHGQKTAPESTAQIARAFAERLPVAVELALYRRDGREFWARVQISPVVEAGGRLNAFVGILSDVTAHRYAEEALRESERGFRAIAKAVPMPMVVIRLQDGAILDANARLGDLLGIPARRLIGRTALEFCATAADGRRLAEKFLRAGRLRHGETKLLRADGGVLWVLGSAEPVTVNGEVAAIAIFHDVTERKREEIDLRHAKEAAEHANRAKTRFFAAASHDLRQPLQALALFTGALAGRITEPQGRDIIASMKVALHSMEEMFDSLLDMSKLDAGVLTAQFDDFPIQALLDRLHTEFESQARSKGLSLRVMPCHLEVRSDPQLLARILRNLLTNALRYTPRGRILVGCRRQGAILRVEVWDSGKGIPKNQLSRIFDEFYQFATRDSDRSGGLGLGLAIVERLTRLLRHRLSVASVVGRGSVFRVDLPRAEAHELVAEPALEQRGLSPLEGAVVAVIDDDTGVREALRVVLEAWGCRAITAVDLDQTLLSIRALGLVPDLVITDLQVHGGWPGLPRLRDAMNRIRPEMPIFVLTGAPDALSGQEAGLASGMRLLRKPVDPDRLLPLLEAALIPSAMT